MSTFHLTANTSFSRNLINNIIFIFSAVDLKSVCVHVHALLIVLIPFQYGGINVDVQASEGGVFIAFTAYHPGDAPALIINHTSQLVKFWEKGNSNERCLEPFEKMLYTWQDPTGDRLILWNDGDDSIENDLRRDGVKPIKSSVGDTTSYWVSFLDGTQRVLLFTNVQDIAFGANSANRLDKVNILKKQLLMQIHSLSGKKLRFNLGLNLCVVSHF